MTEHPQRRAPARRRGLYPLLVIDEVGCISFEAAVDTDDVPQAPAAGQ